MRLSANFAEDAGFWLVAPATSPSLVWSKMIFLLFNQKQRQTATALLSVFGIGFKGAQRACAMLGFRKHLRMHRLSSMQIERLKKILSQKFPWCGAQLQRRLETAFNRLIRISSYRGFRHAQKLPSRGQRTRTNAKTRRRLRLWRTYAKQSFWKKTKILFKESIVRPIFI